jgi:two-component system cell cycle sensor histidine kinase/response regulator CckA
MLENAAARTLSSPRASVHRRLVFVATSTLMIVALVIDAQTPRGVADWQAHALLVCLALTVPGRWHVLATAVGCSVCLITGYFLTGLIDRNPEFPLWVSMFNRTLALVNLWLITAGGLAVRRVLALRSSNETLLREAAERQLELQTLQTQKLEAVSRLAAGVAHDINNILTPLTTVLSRLEHPLSAEERVDLVRALRMGTERGTRMVRNLLQYAGGERISLKRLPVPVQPVVQEVANLIAQTLPADIRLEIDVAEGVHPVLGDETQLAQVLMNLCMNARDSMPDGGTLTIEAGNAAALLSAGIESEQSTGHFVRVCVMDTGCGIPATQLDRIFDPFFTTKPHGKGTGLGLASVKQIVHNHGGKLKVLSKPGIGSSFLVYWPASQWAADGSSSKSVLSAMPRAVESVPQSDTRDLVLLVDDEALNLTVMQMVLRDDGFRVLTARDGRAALELYREQRSEVRAVVLDLMMPGINGLEVVNEIRNLDPHCPVVFISGIASFEPLAVEIREKRLNLLPKPFTAEKLLEVVNQAAGR